MSTEPGADAMTEAEVLALFQSCSNHGRWGPDDERGTLNHITAAKRVDALRSVSDGVAHSLAFRLTTPRSDTVRLDMLYVAPDPIGAGDSLHVTTHGFENTHMDSVGHTFFAGALYNGRRVTEHVRPEGLAFGDIEAMSDGIITRGVLLDIARARGRAYLDVGDGVTAADLDRAAAAAGVRVEPGDAVLIRTGRGRRTDELGPEDNRVRDGVLPDVIPWLHAHEVAVYGGDCIERLPSGYPAVPMPLHQVGHAAMGLAILDIVDMEALRRACDLHGRATFALVVAPLRIPGGTGSLVNPLAIF